MHRTIWATAVLAGLTPSLLWAAESTPTPEPARGQAESHRSAFDGFRRFEEARDSDWKGANERVRETGGHGGALADDEDAAAPPAMPSHSGPHQ